MSPLPKIFSKNFRVMGILEEYAASIRGERLVCYDELQRLDRKVGSVGGYKELESFRLTDKESRRVESMCASWSWSDRQHYVDKLRRRHRNAAIYRDWCRCGFDVAAREVVLENWRLRLGIKGIRTMRKIVQEIMESPDSLPVEDRAEIDGIRNLQASRALESALRETRELEIQVNQLVGRRDTGIKWEDVEVIEESGKNQTKRIRRLPIGDLISGKMKELQGIHSRLSSQMNAYLGNPEQRVKVTHDTDASPTEEVGKLLERLSPVPAKIEVVQDE